MELLAKKHVSKKMSYSILTSTSTTTSTTTTTTTDVMI
jgi:hypothetical protein